MEIFLQQIEKALEYNLYYLALQSVLTLPDICSSLISSNPEHRNVYQEYVDWCSKNFDFAPLSADDCYYFRCSNLHQGKTIHRKLRYSRVLFIEPSINIHIYTGFLDDALCIDINKFCKDMISAVRIWLDSVKNTEPFESNYKNFMKCYPNGIPPYIVGVPIIT